MNIDDIFEEVLQQIPQPLWENWYIKEKIGSGGFSAVYRVEAERTKRVDVAALKIEPIFPDERFADDEERSLSFLKQKRAEIEEESSIMYKLRNCPNIVSYEEETVKEFIQNGKLVGYIFLIRMELLQNVYDIMTSRQLNTDEANIIRLGKEIGAGLKAAHDIGVIHRDVKPSNFFISKNGTYKLGDFNIAKQTSYTRSFAGTEGYIAPEVYRAKSGDRTSYSAQADIYSLGICLYQFMNNGLFPFEDTVLTEEAIDKRMSGEELSPPKYASENFSRIILKACAFAPEDRYANMSEMLDDLDKLNAPKVDAYVGGAGFDVPKSTATVYAGNTSYSSGNETKYADNSVYMQSQAVEASRSLRKKTNITVSAIIALIAVLGGLLFFAASISKDKKHDDKAVISEVTDTSLTTVTIASTAVESTSAATTTTTSTASTSTTTSTSTTETTTSETTTTETTTTTEIITTTAAPVYGTGWLDELDSDIDGDGVEEHIEVYRLENRFSDFDLVKYRVYDNESYTEYELNLEGNICKDAIVYDANIGKAYICGIGYRSGGPYSNYMMVGSNYNINMGCSIHIDYNYETQQYGEPKYDYYNNGVEISENEYKNYMNNITLVYSYLDPNGSSLNDVKSPYREFA